MLWKSLWQYSGLIQVKWFLILIACWKIVHLIRLNLIRELQVKLFCILFRIDSQDFVDILINMNKSVFDGLYIIQSLFCRVCYRLYAPIRKEKRKRNNSAEKVTMCLCLSLSMSLSMSLSLSMSMSICMSSHSRHLLAAIHPRSLDY